MVEVRGKSRVSVCVCAWMVLVLACACLDAFACGGPNGVDCGL